MTMLKKVSRKYWTGQIGLYDDLGQPITDTFYDAKTRGGPWGSAIESAFTLYFG